MVPNAYSLHLPDSVAFRLIGGSLPFLEDVKIDGHNLYYRRMKS